MCIQNQKHGTPTPLMQAAAKALQCGLKPKAKKAAKGKKNKEKDEADNAKSDQQVKQ